MILFLLLFLTFIIAGAEVALFSLNKDDINLLKTKTHPPAKRIISLLSEPKEVYTSLVLAEIFVNICLILLFNLLAGRFISFAAMPGWLEIALKVIVISGILLLFGKLLPKVWAAQSNLRFAYSISFMAEWLHLLLGGISKRIVSLAGRISRTGSRDPKKGSSIAELNQAIDIKPDEEISPEEKNILKGVIKFGNIHVKQVMKERLEVSGLEYGYTFREVIKKTEELHYSRLPVYRNNLDEIVGVMNTKDLLPWLEQGEDFDWHPLMRQPYFIPETKLIEDLLKDFQQKRIHFAIVVDEFGGTSGIVTMEDVVEEIIGEIKDEFDEEESGSRQLDEFNYIFEGKMMIHEMCERMNLPIDTFDAVKGESESVAGLVLELAGKFPAINEIIACTISGSAPAQFDFTVLQEKDNRIQQVKITVRPQNN